MALPKYMLGWRITVKAVQLLKYIDTHERKSFGPCVAGAHIILYHFPSMDIRRPSFKAQSTQRTTSPHWPSVHPSATSVFLHWSIHVLVLHSSDPLWCLIPSWLCPPSVHGAALPVMNIQRSAYLTGLSPPFKAAGDNSSATKKHTQWIFFAPALFLWLSFAPSLPSVFVHLGFH